MWAKFTTALLAKCETIAALIFQYLSLGISQPPTLQTGKMARRVWPNQGDRIGRFLVYWGIVYFW
jgi:hypothetical protein